MRSYRLVPGKLLEWESAWRRGLEARAKFVVSFGTCFTQFGVSDSGFGFGICALDRIWAAWLLGRPVLEYHWIVKCCVVSCYVHLVLVYSSTDRSRETTLT